jgi:hypothetical protein
MEFLTNNLDTLLGVHLVASALSAVFPTTSFGRLGRVVDILALNVSKAKNVQ